MAVQCFAGQPALSSYRCQRIGALGRNVLAIRHAHQTVRLVDPIRLRTRAKVAILTLSRTSL
jgi:hypothetical protein